MSRSEDVFGIIPADGKYNEMKLIYDTCRKNEIPVPEEVDDFFEGLEPNGIGVEVSIESKEGRGDGFDFIDVDVRELPEHVKIVRFKISY